MPLHAWRVDLLLTYYEPASGALTTTSSGGLATSNHADGAANGGSLISKAAVPDGTSQYEVKATLNLTQSGGDYALYLRATSDTLYGSSTSGTYYVLQIQNPTFTNGSCSATLALNKRVNGVITQIQNNPIGCHNGMTIRLIYSINNWIIAYIDNGMVSWNGDAGISVSV